MTLFLGASEHYLMVLFYRVTLGQYLVKPVPGDWNEDWENPLALWFFKPRLTDENGYLNFTGLSFATNGNLGASNVTFRFQMRCGSALSPEYNITVKSRINQLTVNPFSAGTHFISYKSTYDDDTFIKLTDINGKGVPGKVIDSIQVIKDNLF